MSSVFLYKDVNVFHDLTGMHARQESVAYIFLPLFGILARETQWQGFKVDSSSLFSKACVFMSTFILCWFSVSQFTDTKIMTLKEEVVIGKYFWDNSPFKKQPVFVHWIQFHQIWNFGLSSAQLVTSELISLSKMR